MQRLLQRRYAFSLLIALTLYGAAAAFATPEEQPAKPAAVAAETAKPAPHIALLLPLDSPAFGVAAGALKQGFLAAAKVQAAELPVTVYPADETPEKILATYQRALAAGAKIVVGPLTRSGVGALAASNLVQVPTLALNIPEGDTAVQSQLYLFGLAVESEARQAARQALEQGKRKALIVGDDVALARRMRAAFADEWQKSGGELAGQFAFKSDDETLLALRDEVAKSAADIVFLALDGEKARSARPYIDYSVATYATSLVNRGRNDTLANFDLNGVHFFDMPWLLLPDHPAVMIYPRSEIELSAEHERLYAFGIDAYRLALLLLDPPRDWDIALDGVTGHLTLDRNHQFARELIPARFSQGEAVVSGGAKP